MPNLFDSVCEMKGLKSTYLAWGIVAALVLGVLISILSLGFQDGPYKLFKYIATSVVFIYVLISMIWWFCLYSNSEVKSDCDSGDEGDESVIEWKLTEKMTIFEYGGLTLEVGPVQDSRAASMRTFEWQVQDSARGEWVACSTLHVREMFEGATTTCSGTNERKLTLDRLERAMNGCSVRCKIISASSTGPTAYTNACAVSVVRRRLKVDEVKSSPANALMSTPDEAITSRDVALTVVATVDGDNSATVECQWFKNGELMTDPQPRSDEYKVTVNAVKNSGDVYRCRVLGVDAKGTIFDTVDYPVQGYMVGVDNGTAYIFYTGPDNYYVTDKAGFSFTVNSSKFSAHDVLYINGEPIITSGSTTPDKEGAKIEIIKDSQDEMVTFFVYITTTQDNLSAYFANASVVLSVKEDIGATHFFPPGHIHMKSLSYTATSWPDPGVEDGAQVLHDLPGATKPLVLSGSVLRALIPTGSDNLVHPGKYGAYGGGTVTAISQPDERRVDVYDVATAVSTRHEAPPVTTVHLGLLHEMDFGKGAMPLAMNANHDLAVAFLFGGVLRVRVLVCGKRTGKEPAWYQRGDDILIPLPGPLDHEGCRLYLDSGARNIAIALPISQVFLTLSFDEAAGVFGQTIRQTINYVSHLGMSFSADFSRLAVPGSTGVTLYEMRHGNFEPAGEVIKGQEVGARFSANGDLLLIYTADTACAIHQVYKPYDDLNFEPGTANKPVHAIDPIRAPAAVSGGIQLDEMTSCNGDFSIITTGTQIYTMKTAASKKSR